MYIIPFTLIHFTSIDYFKNNRRTPINARKCPTGFQNFGNACQGNKTWSYHATFR